MEGLGSVGRYVEVKGGMGKCKEGRGSVEWYVEV